MERKKEYQIGQVYDIGEYITQDDICKEIAYRCYISRNRVGDAYEGQYADFLKVYERIRDYMETGLKEQKYIPLDRAVEWLLTYGVFNSGTCKELREYVESFKKAFENDVKIV